MRGHAPLNEECCRRGLQPRLGIAVVAMVAIAKAVGVVGENIPTGVDGGIEIRIGVVEGAVIGEDCSGGGGGGSSSSSIGSRGGWISIVAIGGAGAGGMGLIIAGSGGGGSGSRRVSYSTGGITAVTTGGAGVGGVGIVVLVVLAGVVVQLGVRVRMRMRMLTVGKLLGIMRSPMKGHGSGKIPKGRLSIFHRRETAHHGDRNLIESIDVFEFESVVVLL